jgi:hypothetical protein
MIPEGQKSVEALDEGRVSVEKMGDTRDDPRSIDSTRWDIERSAQRQRGPSSEIGRSKSKR